MSGSDKRSVSTDALETLGTLIDAGAKRDAIHVAVEPVTAGANFNPGEHVSVEGGIALPALVGKGLGIVDPFLPTAVRQGERFWLLMYPRQIKSLRHVWTHPAFPDEPVVGEPDPDVVVITRRKSDSEKWLREFVDRTGLSSYDALISAAQTGGAAYEPGSDYYGVSFSGGCVTTLGSDDGGDIPSEFWDHLEVVTGVTFPREDRPEYFSCSC